MTLGATQFPRLLAGLGGGGPLGLPAHVRLYGPMPGPRGQGSWRSQGSRADRTDRGGDHALIEQLERAGLRGYGGAGFPTATKLRAVAAQRGRPVVVVNATEGEPLSRKDALLLAQLPHLVLDGALVAAALLRATTVMVAIDEDDPIAASVVAHAASERPALWESQAPRLHVQAVPRGYVSGQETALVSALNGGAAKPRLTPPYPFERGVGERPTFVSNAETFAQLGLVARYGAGWWRALGSDAAPGTRLVTVSGGVAYPGVLEVAAGTSLSRLLEAAGGAVEPLQGLLVGGYAGTWIGPDRLAAHADEPSLRAHGATLGAGIVFALPGSACAVAEVAHAARWMWSQSAGQCGPCVHGLGAIADALGELCDYGDRHGAYGQIERWCGLVTRRGACALPDGVARFVASALHVFRPQFDDHARHGACDACAGARLLPAGATAVMA